MNDPRDTDRKPGHPLDVGRRKLNVAVLAMLAGGLGTASPAQALLRRARGDFTAASRILAPYGVTVSGSESSGHDVVGFEIAALPETEYTQVVGTPGRLGEIQPCIKTPVFGDDAGFTHFHPGEIIPCIKTTIEGHTRGLHELFDADQRGIAPCFTVDSEMLEGGNIGTIVATHFHDGAIVPCVRTTIEGHSLATHELFDASEGDIVPCIKVASEMLEGGVLGAVEVAIDADLRSFRVVIEGGNTYKLDNGELVLESPPR